MRLRRLERDDASRAQRRRSPARRACAAGSPRSASASDGRALATSAVMRGGRPGQHFDGEAGRDAALHEHVAGIAHQRHARVADQRDDGAVAHLLDQLGGPRALVVLVVGDELRRRRRSARAAPSCGACPRRRPRRLRAARRARAGVTSSRFPIGVGQTTRRPVTRDGASIAPVTTPSSMSRARMPAPIIPASGP